MDAIDPFRRAAPRRVPGATRNYPAVLRAARRAQGLTQEQLGQLCGYSAATISRFETGARRLTDIDTLAVFVRVLSIPPVMFGLDAVGSVAAATPKSSSEVVPALVSSRPANLSGTRSDDGGDEDAMRRRNVLAGVGLTAVTGGRLASVAVGAASTAGTDAVAIASLESMLYGGLAPARPVPLAEVRRRLDVAKAAFDACRYHELASYLPRVAAVAHAGCSEAPERVRGRYADMVSQGYLLSSELCVKFGEDGMAWVAADRAVSAATNGADPAVHAAAVRSVAIAMRRHGHHDGATALLTRTAEQLGVDRGVPPNDLLAAYASLLCTAAYSRAQNGDPDQAIDLVRDAARVADRIGGAGLGPVVFGSAHVAVYRIGIHTALGEPAQAIRHAQTIDPSALPTPERRARLFIDTARAWEQYGRLDRSYLALRTAERQAPEEISRPSVRGLISRLLSAPGRTPDGLRALAVRTGASA